MSPRKGIERLDEDLHEVRALIRGRSEIYARALELLGPILGPDGDRAILAHLEAAWGGRDFVSFYERPLLLLASMRAAALASPEHPLAAALDSSHPELAALSTDALVAALGADQGPIWATLRTRRVQTNDVSRAIAWRWPAHALGSRPLVLVDIGCAAGLNLVADALPSPWKDQDGAPLEVAAQPTILERVGFDASPIDVRHADETAWLHACIWPGDHGRIDQLDEAIEAMVSAWGRPDAPRLWPLLAEQVPARLDAITKRAPEGAVVLAYQSFVREYLEGEAAVAYVAGMRSWLDGLPPGRGMWTELELRERSGELPAELVVHLTGGRSLALGRCSYHPSRVDVDRAAVAALAAAFASPGVLAP